MKQQPRRQSEDQAAKNFPKNIALIGLSFFFIVVLAAWTFWHRPEQGRVVKIIDGDTIILDNGEVVRYIGIDTPEVSVPATALECYGPEATEKNRELVEGQEVKLIRDIKNKDKYGRLLRYVYVQNSNIFVNLELIKSGYARTLTVYPNVSYAREIEVNATKAQRDKRGMWSVENCQPDH